MAQRSQSSKERACGKAPDAFRTISEVAEELDVPQHVLRFWETRFRADQADEARRRPALLPAGGHRAAARHPPPALRRGLHDPRRPAHSKDQGVRLCRTSGGRARRGRLISRTRILRTMPPTEPKQRTTKAVCLALLLLSCPRLRTMRPIAASLLCHRRRPRPAALRRPRPRRYGVWRGKIRNG